LKDTSQAFKNIEWPVKNIRAFSTTIVHPNLIPSSSIYGGFNIGNHVGDNPTQVHFNRSALLDYLPENANIQWLEQVHGNHVVSINKQQNNIIADALVSKEKNIALAIMTADCLPIILSTLDGGAIGAIHGGWKPLAKGIIKNTIEAMSLNPNDLYVWLGPCIGKHAFEVGVDVYNVFKGLNLDYEHAFKLLPYNDAAVKYLADLHTIAKIQLNDLGVTNIYTLPDCTYSMDDTYYSYRKKKVTGRMATVICSI
jgi:YfiH family protein